MNARSLAAASFATALCGCVAFEHLPEAVVACDPMLEGRWTPSGMSAADAVVIDQQCRALIPGNSRAKGAAAQPVRLELRSFQLGDDRYLVFTKNDIENMTGLAEASLIGSDLQSVDKQVFLMRYRIDGKTLQTAMADQDYASDAIDERSIRGKPLGDTVSLVEAGAADMPGLLASHPDLFVSQGRGFAEFERLGPGRAP